MRVAILNSPTSHCTSLLLQFTHGIERGADTVETFASPNGRITLPGFDAAVCWGWRRGKRLRQANPTLPVLVVERGYVGDRFHWTSLGWNGLNGNAIFPKPPSLTEGMLRAVNQREGMAEWRDPNARTVEGKPGYALILGQVQGDQACANVNLAYQYRAWEAMLQRAGYEVKFRPHPKAVNQATGLRRGAYTRGTLADDLAGAAFTVSWNSNSSVDSVLAGVPSVTLDRGAMAWDVTSHDLRNPVTMPSRLKWAAQLAWCQWNPSELSNGTAWEHVRKVKP